ncbi:MAG: type VI secretion system tube protein Hcp [Gammaproteobacteria bacterium]|nr:type VI secretion system tube protein Hcp [Gammaproteobacteria bacterium]
MGKPSLMSDASRVMGQLSSTVLGGALAGNCQGLLDKLENVQGESADKGHEKWLDLEFWRFSTRRKITSATSTRGDRESSNTVITDLYITRRMDSATPRLFMESCCGTGQTVILHQSKTGVGTGSEVFLEYTLKNSLIRSYSVGGTCFDRRRPIEHIYISFVEIVSKYVQYDEDNKAMSPVIVGFDTARNIKL